jgi:hypothetical protein
MSARAQLGALALGVLAVLAGTAAAGTLPSRSGSPSISGRIVLAHQDAATPAGSRYEPMLQTSHGLIALHLSSGLSAPSGSRVVLHDPTYRNGAIVSADLARLGPPTVNPESALFGPADFTASRPSETPTRSATSSSRRRTRRTRSSSRRASGSSR